MFKGWTWKRFAVAAAGAATFAAGFVFPPVAALTAPIGAGLVGLAIKTPGDVTKDALVAHGESVAEVVAPAVASAVLTSVTGGVRNVAVLASVAKDAAAAELAKYQAK